MAIITAARAGVAPIAGESLQAVPDGLRQQGRGHDGDADGQRRSRRGLPESPCGAEVNMAKHLASEASWAAADVTLATHGGYGFLDRYDIERKFRETRMFPVAPINNNLIKAFVATKVLGLPRSY